MGHRFADIAFTPAVQHLQQQHGSRTQYARLQARGGPNDTLGDTEADFLGAGRQLLPRHGQRNRLAVRAAPRRTTRIPAGAVTDATRVRRLPRQPAVHQRRQRGAQRPRVDHRRGLCHTGAA